MSGKEAGAPAPTARVFMDFERPVEAVKALFFDVDLAVRDKIHRGSRLKWILHGESGEKRLKQTQLVMGRLTTEEVVIERGPEGEWIKRLMDGPNVGTRFVATFESLEENKTRVTMCAYVGPRGFAQGLGKLSPVGIEKTMRKGLNEYKRALEGYEPGRARGEVLRVIEEWGDISHAMRGLDDKRRSAAVSTLVETAWSIAAVDEDVDAAERDAMRAVIEALWHTTIDAETEEKMVDAAMKAVKDEGVAARCTILGGRLKALGFAELGISLAVLVAEVSHGLDPAELEALQHLATAADLDGGRLLDIIRHTDDALSGSERYQALSQFV